MRKPPVFLWEWKKFNGYWSYGYYEETGNFFSRASIFKTFGVRKYELAILGDTFYFRKISDAKQVAFLILSQ